MENVVLDDSGMFWINGGFFPAGSFSIIPSWFGRTLGWRGLVKGAASVMVCTALILTARRYYFRRQRARNKELTNGHTLPNGTGANHHAKADVRRRLVVTPSNSRPPRVGGRHRHLSSEVATVSFADTDSETEADSADVRGVSVEAIPVVDDVGREADDESSELEEDILLYNDTDILEREISESPMISDSALDECEPAEDISEFCLAFESDSTISEPELTLITEDKEGPLRSGRIVMDLASNGHVPMGFVKDKEDGGEVDEEECVTEGSQVSLDDVRTSVIEDIDSSSNVVVTQAVVSLA